MPKSGGSGRPFNKNTNTYFEHDNRGESVRRSVTFKRVGGYGPHPGGRGGSNVNIRNNNRRWRNPGLVYDTDVDMGGSGRGNNFSNAGDGRRKISVAMLPGIRGQRRNALRGQGRNARQGSPPSMRTNKHLPTSPNHWYKVVVFHGARYERKWLIDNLNAAVAPDTFTAIGTQNNNVFFFVDDFQVAKKIQNVNNYNHRLKTEDGYTLNVLVKPFMERPPTVDDTLKEILKVVMARRFRADEGSLDLSRFHADSDLVDKFVPLNQKPILSAVLSLVVDHCPSLHALDLSHNHIYSLDGVKTQVSKLVNLRILFLAHNQMPHISSLDPLKGLAVEQLLMDANPLCAKYSDQGAYVTDIRKRLPKLLKLDGVDLPPPILFDVETTQLPPSQKNFFCADEGKEIARQFLEKYYEFYDSPNRENLRAAYHENAMLSLSLNFPQNSGSGNREKAMLNEYQSNSRNLKRVMDLDRRMRLLKCGHEEIMKLLCSLPSSQHDLHSFSVDLILYTPQLIQLCVCGVFRESRASGNVPVRAFNRGLLIVPQGGGFCIVNETVTITNATSTQANAAFKTSLVHVAPVPSVSAPVVPLMPVPLSPAVGISNQEAETKHKMVEHVARTTGMNPLFSEKCLNECNWNLEQALYAFSLYHKKGEIPPEAFLP